MRLAPTMRRWRRPAENFADGDLTVRSNNTNQTMKIAVATAATMPHARTSPGFTATPPRPRRRAWYRGHHAQNGGRHVREQVHQAISTATSASHSRCRHAQSRPVASPPPCRDSMFPPPGPRPPEGGVVVEAKVEEIHENEHEGADDDRPVGCRPCRHPLRRPGNARRGASGGGCEARHRGDCDGDSRHRGHQRCACRAAAGRTRRRAGSDLGAAAAQAGGGAGTEAPQLGQNAAPGRRSVPHATQFAMVPPSSYDSNQSLVIVTSSQGKSLWRRPPAVAAAACGGRAGRGPGSKTCRGGA